MRIFAIDDEQIMLDEAEYAIRQVAPTAELMAFTSAEAALAVIKEQGVFPDIVFCDIEMPGLSGLEFAVRLKTVSPDARMVFVTAYPQYAVEAFRTRAQGYILKPLTPEQVLTELKELPHPPAQEPQEKLRVQCFGNFEVFWRGEPLRFERRRSKELLAYLIDRRGAACTSEEVIAALWEDESHTKNAKQRYRNLVNDLKMTLKGIGMSEVLIRRGSYLSVRTDMVDCDYYRMLQGDMTAVNTFRGEYMTNYSWAELTLGTLLFQNANQNQ